MEDSDYIHLPLFQDDSHIAARRVEIRKAAKEHKCFGLTPSDHNKHVIEKGERYRYETGFIDGMFWGQYRVCLKCCDRFIAGDY